MNDKWNKFIPWFITIASSVTIIALGWFLVSNLLWFKSMAFPEGKEMSATYFMHVHHLFLSMLKRSVALFAGFAILFIGSSTVFYSVKEQSKLNIKNSNLSVYIATTSPGLIAMLFGLILIMHTVSSKDSFPPYVEGSVQSTNLSSGNAELVVPLIPEIK